MFIQELHILFQILLHILAVTLPSAWSQGGYQQASSSSTQVNNPYEPAPPTAGEASHGVVGSYSHGVPPPPQRGGGGDESRFRGGGQYGQDNRQFAQDNREFAQDNRQFAQDSRPIVQHNNEYSEEDNRQFEEDLRKYKQDRLRQQGGQGNRQYGQVSGQEGGAGSYSGHSAVTYNMPRPSSGQQGQAVSPLSARGSRAYQQQQQPRQAYVAQGSQQPVGGYQQTAGGYPTSQEGSYGQQAGSYYPQQQQQQGRYYPAQDSGAANQKPSIVVPSYPQSQGTYQQQQGGDQLPSWYTQMLSAAGGSFDPLNYPSQQSTSYGGGGSQGVHSFQRLPFPGYPSFGLLDEQELAHASQRLPEDTSVPGGGGDTTPTFFHTQDVSAMVERGVEGYNPFSAYHHPGSQLRAPAVQPSYLHRPPHARSSPSSSRRSSRRSSSSTPAGITIDNQRLTGSVANFMKSLATYFDQRAAGVPGPLDAVVGGGALDQQNEVGGGEVTAAKEGEELTNRFLGNILGLLGEAASVVHEANSDETSSK